MKEEIEDQIQIALQPAPMDREPSEDLLRRLRVMAYETAPRKSKLAWLKLAVPAGAALAALSLITVTTMLPAKASAKSFELIEGAVAQVNAFQFSVISNEDHKHEAFTIAGADGHVYMKGDRTVMEVTPGAMSIYSPEEKMITRIKFGSSMDAQEVAKEIQSGISEGLKEMDLKQMLKDYKSKYGSAGVQISPITVEDGQRVYHVTLSSNNEPERVEMTVDASSDLPQTLEVEEKSGGAWKSNVKMEMRFGIRVDQNLLRADFPKDAQVQEIDLGSMIGGALKGLEHLGDSVPQKK